MFVCLISLANGHAHSDRQTGEIAKIWHFRVRCIPKLRFDRLELRQHGSAIGIVRRNLVRRLKIGSVVRVLLRIVTVNHFPLAGGCKSWRFRAGTFGAEFI